MQQLRPVETIAPRRSECIQESRVRQTGCSTQKAFTTTARSALPRAHIKCGDTNARPISIDVVEQRWTLLGHTLRLPIETPGSRVMMQHFESRAMCANERRESTRRGRVLTTLPRLLQRDLREKLTAHERRVHFNVDDLENGRQLDILRMKAITRSRW